MNSIAVPSRTDAVSDASAVRLTRTALGTMLLTLLVVSFTPFQLENGPSTSGNLVNQLGYTSLSVVALAAHFLFTEKRVALSLLRPSWLLMALYLAFSITQSPLPDAATRTVLFTLCSMVAVTAAVTLPPDAAAFRTALKTAALTVLILSYVGLVLLPHAAIHDGSGVEEQAGLWRGIYSHKNVAGPMMAALFFAGLYLIRSGDRAVGWLIAILSAIFVLRTGSKTSASLVPAVAALIIGARLLGGRMLPAATVVVMLALMGLATIGSVLSPTLDSIVQWILPGTTFTGRTDIWRFSLDLLRPHQWTGFGLETFWGSDLTERAEKPFELAWDPRGIVNGHSGYIDLALSLGWPGMAVGVFVLVLQPLADYVRCRPTIENERLADFFLMVLVFMLLNSFMESFFFSRGSPIWMATWLSIVGLHLLARFKLS
ncbi:O-antigen ligase family protein [Mangrovicella endophytica]|uniref:O-antigen ligase family protein n=1 Tax=Mangrovicella endophytica TaxID=2066697 RepID=UPI0012FFEC49|nr:O-antigen ligase [Mangrovicella endophytica]